MENISKRNGNENPTNGDSFKYFVNCFAHNMLFSKDIKVSGLFGDSKPGFRNWVPKIGNLKILGRLNF